VRAMQKVLVVEDDDDFAGIIRDILLHYDGIEVEVLRDGAEAIERVETATARLADLVLLDLELPSGSGFEVLQAIRASDTQRSIPVIILTHKDAEEDVERAYSLGANNYLLKTDQLADTLAQVHEYWFGLSKIPRRRYP
jgi:DNA-binding response OmpR family regulator